MGKIVLGGIVVALTLGLVGAAGAGDGPGTGGVLTMAVYGDAPYGASPSDTSQFTATPAFIDSINADPDVSRVLHVGDIHSGKQFCTQPYDQSIYDLWTRFEDPLVYTPGDNEWSDCHKLAEGGGLYNLGTGQIDHVKDAGGNPVDYANGDPIANLELVRSIFFARPGFTLGEHKRFVFSQSRFYDRGHPTDANYVENVMWMQSHVLFVTIDLPGASNNDADVWYGAPTPTAAQTQEVAERTGGRPALARQGLRHSRDDRGEGHRDRRAGGHVGSGKGAAHQAGYEPFVQSIASHTTAFGKPVLMFNGDSHVFQSGNPLTPTDPNYSMHPGYNVPNFHRIVVHGSTTPLEWLRLTVDPRADNYGPTSFGPFNWERITP